MKRFVSIIIMIVTISAAFAYEPKIEYVTIKGNKVQYKESYDWHGFSTHTRSWTFNIKSNKFIYYRSGSFDYMWWKLCNHREQYELSLKIASMKDDTCSTCAFIEKYKSAYENNELNEAEMKQYESMVALHGSANDLASSINGTSSHAKTDTKSYHETTARTHKEDAINEIPFVTEENFLTLTKEELIVRIYDFAKQCTN